MPTSAPAMSGYPMRAIRTREFLYLRNLRPDRWPAGDPQAHKDPMLAFGDCDDGPTKNYILDHRDEPGMQKFFQLCFGKRPAEELYDLSKDPHGDQQRGRPTRLLSSAETAPRPARPMDERHRRPSRHQRR